MEAEKTAVILACDIDLTLVAGMYDPSYREEADQSLDALHGAIAHIKNEADYPFLFGTITGNTPASQDKLENDNESFGSIMQLADFKINSVGARISIKNFAGDFESAHYWPVAPNWNRDAIASTLMTRPELTPQDNIAQDDHKVSFDVHGVSEEYHAQYVAAIHKHLGYIGVRAHVLFSGQRYLDVLPEHTHKGTSFLHTVPLLTAQHHITQDVVTIGAGDSMNDAELLQATDIAILPANADENLQAWTARYIPKERRYVAQRRFAAGVLEGLQRLNIAA